MKIFSTLFFCLLLACSSTASAQESFEVTPSRGLVTLSFGNTPRSNVDNLPGILGSQWGGINAVVPVFRSFSAEAEGGSLNQLALTGSVRKNTMELPLTTSQRTISSLSLGASCTMLSGSRQVYSVSGGIGITEDRLITGSPEARFRLTALGSYRFSEPVLLLYGANFSALFGRDLLLPIIGVNWKMDTEWTGSLILPFSLSVRYAPRRDLIVKAAVRASGQRTRIANDNDYAEAPYALQMRTTGIKGSLFFLGKISNDFRMDGEAGVLAHRNLKITAGDATLFSSSVNSCGFISVGLRFYFSMTDEPDELF